MIYLSTENIILISALLLCLIFQLIYYWGYLIKPYKHQKKIRKKEIDKETCQPPVSIIITGTNEARNIEAHFPAILEQNYPEYEVIFVDNASTDDTEDVLKRFSHIYKHLYHTYIPAGSKNLSRKKLALTLAIKAAKYDALLFTEADSIPCSPDWVSSMAAHFSDKKKIVLGFTYLNQSFSKYVVYDYFFSNLQMLSLALNHRTYMGNGRNLMYSKPFFNEQKGFLQSGFLDAGEDDLFINQVATNDNVAVELSPESMVTFDLQSKKIWEEMRIVRMIAWRFYKKYSVYFWQGEKITRVLFYFLLITSLTFFASTSQWIFAGIATAFFLIRLFSQQFVLMKSAGLFKQPNFYFSVLFYDFIQPFVDSYFYFYVSREKRNNYYNWRYEKR